MLTLLGSHATGTPQLQLGTSGAQAQSVVSQLWTNV
jgi:hypothetical protein